MFREAEEDGLRFECNGCRQCCGGGPGYVWLSKSDLQDLSSLFEMDDDDFVKVYCRKVRVQEGYAISLKERKDFSCIFLEAHGCGVYDHRPAQCRSYPFWSEILESDVSWQEEAKNCPGIGAGRLYTPQEIYENIRLRRKNHPMVVVGPSLSADKGNKSV